MKKILVLVSIFFIVILGGAGFFVFNFFSNSSDSIPLVFGGKKDLDNTDGRTNILAIGVDTRDSKYIQTGTLTDTLMIISIDPIKKDVKFLSLPRDLWVVADGVGMKINEVYTIKGLDTLLATIKQSLDIDIHYYAKADFNAVIKSVDAVGGVTINNPVAFTDYRYPKFGWENDTCGIDIDKLEEQRKKEWEKENKDKEASKMPSTFIYDEDFPCRYEKISFEKGEITLNGESALKYARSRHSLDNGQGSDFARANRQQIIILGIKDKILSATTITDLNKIRELYSNFNEFIETDFTINELILALPYVQESSNYTIRSKVLSNSGIYDEGGVLTQGNYDNYGGRYVLVATEPTSIVTFVNEYFYGDL